MTATTAPTSRPILQAVSASTPASTSAITPEPDWRSRAACVDVDPDLFFPEGAGPAAKAQEKVAKAVCADCPVRFTCLEWAQSTGQRAGVWGGMTEFERIVSRRRPARTHEEKVQRALDHATDVRRWVWEQGRSVAEVADMLGVEEAVASAVVRTLDPASQVPTHRQRGMVQALSREADLRKMRRDGVNLRRSASLLGLSYEAVRLAWKLLEKQDADAVEQLRAGLGVAA